MTEKNIISLNNVCRTYRTETIETRAVSNLDLQVSAGEFVCITGPSGCGKSTLLGILGLLDRPNSGSYWLNGASADQLDRREAAHVRNRQLGFIFQSYNLIGDLSVAENVELPLCYRGLEATIRRDRVKNALMSVGMDHRAGHYPSQLSGGEQQRVGVARAIVGHPIILLADEPTGNLDSESGDAIMNLLGTLHASGITIVMVTHDQRYSRLADRTVQLLDGQLREVSGRLQTKTSSRETAAR